MDLIKNSQVTFMSFFMLILFLTPSSCGLDISVSNGHESVYYGIDAGKEATIYGEITLSGIDLDSAFSASRVKSLEHAQTFSDNDGNTAKVYVKVLNGKDTSFTPSGPSNLAIAGESLSLTHADYIKCTASAYSILGYEASVGTEIKNGYLTNYNNYAFADSDSAYANQWANSASGKIIKLDTSVLDSTALAANGERFSVSTDVHDGYLSGFQDEANAYLSTWNYEDDIGGTVSCAYARQFADTISGDIIKSDATAFEVAGDEVTANMKINEGTASKYRNSASKGFSWGYDSSGSYFIYNSIGAGQSVNTVCGEVIKSDATVSKSTGEKAIVSFKTNEGSASEYYTGAATGSGTQYDNNDRVNQISDYINAEQHADTIFGRTIESSATASNVAGDKAMSTTEIKEGSASWYDNRANPNSCWWDYDGSTGSRNSASANQWASEISGEVIKSNAAISKVSGDKAMASIKTKDGSASSYYSGVVIDLISSYNSPANTDDLIESANVGQSSDQISGKNIKSEAAVSTSANDKSRASIDVTNGTLSGYSNQAELSPMWSYYFFGENLWPAVVWHYAADSSGKVKLHTIASNELSTVQYQSMINESDSARSFLSLAGVKNGHSVADFYVSDTTDGAPLPRDI